MTTRLVAIIAALALFLALASPAAGPVTSFVGSVLEPGPAAASTPPPAKAPPARATMLDPADETLAFGGPVAPGSTRGLDLSSPVVGLAPSSTATGAWVGAADGGVFAFGDSGYFGSMGASKLNKPIVGIAASASDHGYWLVASDGGIFAFGDSTFYGSTGAIQLNQPIVGMARTPSGLGYWLVASDGGIFAYGDAHFFGSMGAVRLNKPVVGIASTPSGAGYWMVASDGGIFAFGDAAFYGSTGAIGLQAPIVGIAPAADAHGYRLVAADGGVFAFGSGDFRGSAGGDHLLGAVVGVAALAPVATTPAPPTPDTAGGYWLLVRRERLSEPPPASWLLMDRSGGAPIEGGLFNTMRRPASTSKMVTALAAVKKLPADATFPISARAAAMSGSGAGAKVGEVWSMEDALHGLLLPSGNDIAIAIAERVSGSVEAFGPVMTSIAHDAGAGGTWNDPAGLDGSQGVGGGNWATARDLAKIATAVLADPRLARIVATPAYTYAGGYGLPHTILNTNRLLRTDPTVVGVKTGTTDASGPSLVAAATRRGRAVVAVVLGAITDRFNTADAIFDDTPSPPRPL